MTPIRWFWILGCVVNIIAISVIWWKLYDEQPNDFPTQIISALIVATGPVGTYFLFVMCSLGYGLVMAAGALQGLGFTDKKGGS